MEGVWPCAAHAKGTTWAFRTNNERDTDISDVTDVIVALWGFDVICYSCEKCCRVFAGFSTERDMIGRYL